MYSVQCTYHKESTDEMDVYMHTTACNIYSEVQTNNIGSLLSTNNFWEVAMSLSSYTHVHV